jgi:transcriptional regulator with XRE-family HTH domain
LAEKFPTRVIENEYFFVYLTIKGQDLKRFTMLGQKLRELREAKGLVQRQVAAELEVDTAYVSKIESNEKPVSRYHLEKLSLLFNVSKDDLMTLWLADRVYDLLKDEKLAMNAIHKAESLIKSNVNRK